MMLSSSNYVLMQASLHCLTNTLTHFKQDNLLPTGEGFFVFIFMPLAFSHEPSS